MAKEEDYDEKGNLIKPDYELSENQERFVREAEENDLTVDYGYSGRGMYGKKCPSVDVDDLNDGIRNFTKKTKIKTDNMGKGYVIYAQD